MPFFSPMEQMLAMMDPGKYEDMKQTLGDVGPWPGRPNAQEFDWRESAPSGTDLVGGAATGAGLAGLFNIGFAGITPRQARKSIIGDMTRELGDQVKLAVSTKGYSPGIVGSDTIVYPKSIYKNKNKLVAGIEEAKGLSKEYGPAIQSVGQGMARLEPFEQYANLFEPIKYAKGRLLDDTIARYYPGIEQISMSSGNRARKVNTNSNIILHELFHGKLKEPDFNILRDLERNAQGIRNEFGSKAPFAISDSSLNYITSPHELLAETAAQKLLEQLLGKQTRPIGQSIQWDKYNNWPSSATAYLDDVIGRLK
jgi:hypothetical protein